MPFAPKTRCYVDILRDDHFLELTVATPMEEGEASEHNVDTWLAGKKLVHHVHEDVQYNLRI